MKVKPLNDRVLVKRMEEVQVTKGGILIPDTAKPKKASSSTSRAKDKDKDKYSQSKSKRAIMVSEAR